MDFDCLWCFFWNQDLDGDFESRFGKIRKRQITNNFNIAAREIEGDRQQGACKNDGETWETQPTFWGMCSS